MFSDECDDNQSINEAEVFKVAVSSKVYWTRMDDDDKSEFLVLLSCYATYQ